MLKLFFMICLLLLTSQEKALFPPKFVTKVIGIKDGDTIEILYEQQPYVIRLAHIDCPEIRKGQPFGKAAKQFTSTMCFGQIVTIFNQNKFDRYKRLIAVVINQHGENVNQKLVAAGLAWHFKKYSTDQTYAALEKQARYKHIGLWKDKNPIAPWDWRKLPSNHHLYNIHRDNGKY